MPPRRNARYRGFHPGGAAEGPEMSATGIARRRLIGKLDSGRMTLKLAGERVLCTGAAGAAILVGLLSPDFAHGQAVAATPDAGFVMRALANELHAAQDTGHPMQYRLRKSSPRLTSTKLIIETKDGAVARLLSINDASPSLADRQREEARLNALLADPSRQRKRMQREQDDTGRALKVLRALPRAFVFQYAGSETDSSIPLARYTFTPNPKFSSNDLELMVLTAMSGTLAVDAAHERVVRLEGRLQQDVDIGWGILGRLDKGGWITMEQADVGAGQWRIVRFQMAMTGRVFFKSRSFNTTEEESHFAPVPVGLSYQQAIEMLRSDGGNPALAGK